MLSEVSIMMGDVWILESLVRVLFISTSFTLRQSSQFIVSPVKESEQSSRFYVDKAEVKSLNGSGSDHFPWVCLPEVPARAHLTAPLTAMCRRKQMLGAGNAR